MKAEKIKIIEVENKVLARFLCGKSWFDLEPTPGLPNHHSPNDGKNVKLKRLNLQAKEIRKMLQQKNRISLLLRKYQIFL